MAKITLTSEQKQIIYPRVEDFLWSERELTTRDGSASNPDLEVAQMQECLVVLGFDLPLFGVDGIFRNETFNALKAYQEASRIKVDGICGPETHLAFYNDIVPPGQPKTPQIPDTKTKLIELAYTDPNSFQNLNKKAFDFSKYKPYFLRLLDILISQAIKFDFVSATVLAKEFQKFENGCPTPPALGDIIKKRNNVAKNLNNIGRFIEGFNKTIRVLTGVVGAFQTILQAGKVAIGIAEKGNLAAIATGVGIPAVVPVNNFVRENLKNILFERTYINTRKDSIEPGNVQAVVAQSAKILASLSFGVGIVNSIVIKAKIKLADLDNLIQQCAQDQVDLEQISSFINSISSEQIEELQTVETSYKNFTFEIKEQEGQSFQSYPKRYAVAIDVNGVIVLESERSFTSTPQILIEELKFIIDRDDLKSE